MTAETTLSRFAVIGADGVHVSDGSRLALPQFQQLAYWLDAAQRRQIDTLWLHPSAGWRWRDADIDACAPWTVAGSGGETAGEPWWTATRQGVYGVRNIVQPIYEDRASWRETPDAATLRTSLLAFRDALGMEWRRSPGATGTRLLRSLHSGAHATRLEMDGPPPPPATERLVRDGGHISWTRPLRADERALFLHSFDVNAQYLAACSSLALGVGAWQHHSHVPLPQKASDYLPGYYRVKRTERAVSASLPPIMKSDSEWVTTPTLRLLRESDATLRILESYTWFEHKRYLEGWYRRLRDARLALTDPYAIDAVKGLYRHAVSWFDSNTWDRSKDALYRPDWAHQIRAQARASVLRTVARVGAQRDCWPVAVGSDCLYYLDASPDPLAARCVTLIGGQGMQPTDGVRLSRQMGHYKVKDAGVPVAELGALLQPARGGAWSLIPLASGTEPARGARQSPAAGLHPLSLWRWRDATLFRRTACLQWPHRSCRGGGAERR